MEGGSEGQCRQRPACFSGWTAWSDGSATVTETSFPSPLPSDFYFPAPKVAGECHTLGQACGSCPWLSRWCCGFLAVLSLTTLKPQPCLLVFHSGSLLPFLLVLEKLGLSSRAVPPLLHQAPRLAPKDAETGVFFSHGACVPSICLLGRLLGQAALPLSHQPLALCPGNCHPVGLMCQAPAASYRLVLIGHLPVVNPSLASPS